MSAIPAGRRFSLVLTMGRVASTSVRRSIEAGTAEPVFHVHSITPRLLAKQVARKGGLDEAPRSALEGLEAVAALARSRERVRVVTLVREPLSRAHSAAFAVLRASHPSPPALERFLADRDGFNRWWRAFEDRRPLDWFDQEIRGMLGIDVFERPFPLRGWDRFESDRCHLLVMRSELDDLVKSDVLAPFYEVDEMPVVRDNDGARSPGYASLYERFKAQAVLSGEYRDLLLDSEYNRHFYG